MKWPFDITRSVDKECKGKPEFLRKNFIKTYLSVEETNIDPIPWVPTLLFESKFNRRASNSDVNHLNHSVNSFQLNEMSEHYAHCNWQHYRISSPVLFFMPQCYDVISPTADNGSNVLKSLLSFPFPFWRINMRI